MDQASILWELRKTPPQRFWPQEFFTPFPNNCVGGEEEVCVCGDKILHGVCLSNESNLSSALKVMKHVPGAKGSSYSSKLRR